MAIGQKIRKKELGLAGLGLWAGLAVSLLVFGGPGVGWTDLFRLTSVVILSSLGVVLLGKIVAILSAPVTENRSDQSKTFGLEQLLEIFVWVTLKVAVFFTVIWVMRDLMKNQVVLLLGTIGLAGVPLLYGALVSRRKGH